MTYLPKFIFFVLTYFFRKGKMLTWYVVGGVMKKGEKIMSILKEHLKRNCDARMVGFYR